VQLLSDGRKTVDPWVNPITDVKDTDWFYGAVEFANRHGLYVEPIQTGLRRTGGGYSAKDLSLRGYELSCIKIKEALRLRRFLFYA